jgi:hypothetical protein
VVMYLGSFMGSSGNVRLEVAGAVLMSKSWLSRARETRV